VAEVRQAVLLAERHHVLADQEAGERGDGEVGADRRALAHVMGAEIGDAEVAARAGQLLQRPRAPDAALLPDGDRQRVLQVRRAAVAARPDELFLHQQFARHRHHAVRRVEDRKVQPPLGDGAAQVAARFDRDVDRDRRIGLGEALQHLRQDQLADVVRRAEPHQPVHLRHHEARHRLVAERQEPPRIGEQHLAVMGEHHRAGVAAKQRAAQHLLKLLDLHGDGRRRAVHGLGGSGEVAGLRDRHEGPEDIELEQRQRRAHQKVHRRLHRSEILNQSVISFRLIETPYRRIVNLQSQRTQGKPP